MLILVIVILLVAGSGGFYGHSRWGMRGGTGISLGSILAILLVAYLLGVIR
jgi:hypothetical protein